MRALALGAILLGLRAAASDASASCAPPCRSGFQCIAGACVEACNPVCGEGLRCIELAPGKHDCLTAQTADAVLSEKRSPAPALSAAPLSRRIGLGLEGQFGGAEALNGDRVSLPMLLGPSFILSRGLGELWLRAGFFAEPLGREMTFGALFGFDVWVQVSRHLFSGAGFQTGPLATPGFTGHGEFRVTPLAVRFGEGNRLQLGPFLNVMPSGMFGASPGIGGGLSIAYLHPVAGEGDGWSDEVSDGTGLQLSAEVANEGRVVSNTPLAFYTLAFGIGGRGEHVAVRGRFGGSFGYSASVNFRGPIGGPFTGLEVEALVGRFAFALQTDAWLVLGYPSVIFGLVGRLFPLKVRLGAARNVEVGAFISSHALLDPRVGSMFGLGGGLALTLLYLP